MTEENTASDGTQSPGLEQSAESNPQMTMDDYAMGLLQQVAPDEFVAETPDDAEVSVEDTNADDDTVEEEVVAEADNDETEEELLEEETDETSNGLTQVDYDEIKQFAIPVKTKNGVEYLSIDQINSEVNRARASHKDVEEANLQKQNAEQALQRVADAEANLKQEQQLSQFAVGLSQIANQLQTLNAAREQARVAGDTFEWNRLSMEMQPLEQQFNQGRAQMDQQRSALTQQKLTNEAQKLEQLGYNSLLSDEQQATALASYLSSTVSPSVANAINMDAELLVQAEKARRWDASQKTKGKIKGNGNKTVKSGDGRLKAVKQANKAKQTQALASGKATEADFEAARMAYVQSLL